MQDKKKKIHLGAGYEVISGYENHDIVPLSGIDVVHNLNIFPWPWDNDSACEVIAIDLIEHLDEFIPTIEEIHRILEKGGILKVKVPYWNSVYCHADPTHKRGFHEFTFHFFDPKKVWCKSRPYYSSARFTIVEEVFILIPFSPYFKIPFIGPIKVRGPIMKRIVGFLGNLFSNIILDLEYTLKKLPLEEELQ